MKLNCLSCGHWFDLRDAYDDYEGQVKCFVCGALLDIRTEEGCIKSVHTATGATGRLPAIEVRRFAASGS